MSRSGYDDDYDDSDHPIALYRGNVTNAINGRRGQSFLRELGAAMDAMQVKKLIASQLVGESGECCAIGAVCKTRGIDVSGVDEEDPRTVGNLVGIAWQMAAEIEYLNDECGRFDETPAARWHRMRDWVRENTKEPQEDLKP